MHVSAIMRTSYLSPFTRLLVVNVKSINPCAALPLVTVPASSCQKNSTVAHVHAAAAAASYIPLKYSSSCMQDKDANCHINISPASLMNLFSLKT